MIEYSLFTIYLFANRTFKDLIYLINYCLNMFRRIVGGTKKQKKPKKYVMYVDKFYDNELYDNKIEYSDYINPRDDRHISWRNCDLFVSVPSYSLIRISPQE